MYKRTAAWTLLPDPRPLIKRCRILLKFDRHKLGNFDSFIKLESTHSDVRQKRYDASNMKSGRVCSSVEYFHVQTNSRLDLTTRSSTTNQTMSDFAEI